MEVKSSTTSPIKLKCPRGPSNTKWVSYRLVAQKNWKLFGNKSTEAWKIKLDVPSVKNYFGSKSSELDLKILGRSSVEEGVGVSRENYFLADQVGIEAPQGNHCTRFIRRPLLLYLLQHNRPGTFSPSLLAWQEIFSSFPNWLWFRVPFPSVRERGWLV